MKNILWYTKPASFKKWEEQSLVIGNGHMGASFFGGIAKEKIVLNEKTLWRGGPCEYRPDYNGGNFTDRYKYVKEVQELLYNKKYEEANELYQKLTGDSDGYGAYQLLCDNYLRFSNIDEAAISDYKRLLDMNTGVCRTEFKYNGALHVREAFASYPDNVICIRMKSDKPHRICVRLELSNIQSQSEIIADDGRISYMGSLLDNGLSYAAVFEVEIINGELIMGQYSVMAEHADEVVIYITAATNYAPVYPNYRREVNTYEEALKRAKSAKSMGWDTLIARHYEDYYSLFGRVDLNLSDENDYLDISTDELVERYSITEDVKIKRQLEELYFQFGRYVLIGSSRKGTLPANLQGVWNEQNSPPWSSDYHINVNLQMNYWGAYNTNLAELSYPLVDFLNSLRPAGRVTAKEYYGIISDESNPENGWIAHTETTPFGWTAPGRDFFWGWSTAAVAWLMQNIWEYYEFTLDKEYLEKAIYPIMRESARFYTQWLIYDDKQERLVSSPTYSPEHGPVTIGNTYEQSLIQQFYLDFIKASEILEQDTELRNTVKEQVSQLKPFKVGKSGKMLEWFDEEEADFDTSKVQQNHRHISHLLGLYPGKAINNNTPDLLKAARITLDDRGDESTGWARAHKLNLWARIGDGNRAFKLLSGLIGGCTFINLFDFHPPFQLDGNFGGSAGIAEMLLQSHEGYISLLPALPDAWESGSIRGLKARGGFEISMAWKNGLPTRVEILSQNGGKCRIKNTPNNKEIIEVETVKCGVIVLELH